MKVYDCFMYFDEDTIVDLRLNCLNNYVDKFVIVESKFTHSGKKRDLLFDINKFDQFKDKIIASGNYDQSLNGYYVNPTIIELKDLNSLASSGFNNV